MKKMIKLSLIAATAVAGFTTTASAKSMEDAIKNVDVSGYVRYRYTNGEGSVEKNQYRLTTTIKSKVNDSVSTKIVLLGQGTTTNDSGDADPTVANIVEANFIYKGHGATVIVGKQALVTPFADGSVDSQQGTGIVALYPVGAVTLAGGWYTNSDATSSKAANGVADVELNGNNITAVAAIGKVANVNYSLWFANVSETTLTDEDGNALTGALAGATAGATAYNVNVKGTFGIATVEVNHAQVDYSVNHADTTSPSQSRVVASAKVAGATATVGVVVTGKDGGDVTLGDTDAKANFSLENLSASDVADDTVYYIGVKAPVAGVTIGAEYATVTDTKNSAGDALQEAKLSVAYKMSKNFKVSGFITEDNFNSDTSRIEVKYTF